MGEHASTDLGLDGLIDELFGEPEETRKESAAVGDIVPDDLLAGIGEETDDDSEEIPSLRSDRFQTPTVERPDTPSDLGGVLHLLLDWLRNVDEERAARLLLWIAQEAVRDRGGSGD